MILTGQQHANCQGIQKEERERCSAYLHVSFHFQHQLLHDQPNRNLTDAKKQSASENA